jgi:hypothetical protein
MKIQWMFTLVLVSSLMLPFLSVEVDARGGRGGGFSRGGVASGGGFSGGGGRAHSQEMNRQAGSREHQDSRQDWSNDNREDRQDWKGDSREDWQDYGEDRQDDRQDFVDDELDDNWDHHDNDWDDGDFAAGVIVGGVLVGAAAVASHNANQVTYVTTLPCQATAVSVEGVSYYKCSSTWYQRGYAGSQVTFIQVAAPPGF